MQAWWLVVLLIAGSARAQSPSRVPFYGANELVVHVPDSGARAWERTVRVLTARGYQVLRPNPATWRVETVPRVSKPYPLITSTVHVRVLGRYLVVRGFYQWPDSMQRPAYQVTYPNRQRSRDGVLAQAWDELEAVARALQGTVWYLGPINSMEK